eukprot:TRINITY_DN7024_c0_g1_i1.p1 TRINITY_DN7024_c0_g1~~TRINITY_DN7024_c0_g1_i1.p1  ORF type:complete len:505 (-),score=103.45 TRINITY_DN7024_c0_g1_i1:11-1525(-)
MEPTEHMNNMISLWRNVTDEKDFDDVQVIGQIPNWLRGTFLRNGCAMFEINGNKVNHTFDGLAMLFRFTIHDSGNVSFKSRFLKGNTYKRSMAAGRIATNEFGTFAFSDPNRSYFSRLFDYLYYSSFGTDNAGVSIMTYNNRYIAQTEVPQVIEFDPVSLDTIRSFNIASGIAGHMFCAHGQAGDDGVYHTKTVFGLGGGYYHLFHMTDLDKPAKLICTIPTNVVKYFHSFGATEKYIVIAAFPYVGYTKDFALQLLTQRPTYDILQWQPSLGTTFYVVEKATGKQKATIKAPPTLAYHHINGFECDDNILKIDMICYNDLQIMHNLSLSGATSRDLKYASNETRRYTLCLDEPEKEATHEVLFPKYLEMPMINQLFNKKPYRYLWGLCIESGQFNDGIQKLDLETGERIVGAIEKNCYPGEAVFIPTPGSDREDDGVIVTSCINVVEHISFLLILNATNLTELARCVIPYQVHYGVHSMWIPSDPAYPSLDLTQAYFSHPDSP